MSKLDISVIIPVYNVEKYLARCLDSVLAAIKNVNGEILLVENNSTDKSPEIILKYAKKYPKRIKPFHCKTQGLSAARNFGAKKALGEFIWFVDSDDEIREDSITKLLNAAKANKADLIMLGMKRLYPNGVSNYLSAVKPTEDNYKSRFVRYGVGGVQVLIRRNWWNNYGFKFKEGIIHEDMEMMSSLILYTDKYAAIDEPLYYYHQNENSILHKNKFNPHIFDIFPALEGLYQRFKKANAAKDYYAELEWFFIWNLLIDSAKDFAKFKEGQPGFAQSRQTLKQYFPHWRGNKFLHQKPLKLRLRILINYYK